MILDRVPGKDLLRKWPLRTYMHEVSRQQTVLAFGRKGFWAEEASRAETLRQRVCQSQGGPAKGATRRAVGERDSCEVCACHQFGFGPSEMRCH